MFPAIRGPEGWKAVRDKICLVTVARELLGEPAYRDGDAFFWPCPFCGGAEPTLQVAAGRSRWRCPACDQWGDAVDLVRRVNRVTFSGALAYLSREEFYPDEGEDRDGSSAGDGPTGGISPDESAGVHDDGWLDRLLRGD
jgi:hypothetical protein